MDVCASLMVRSALFARVSNHDALGCVMMAQRENALARLAPDFAFAHPGYGITTVIPRACGVSSTPRPLGSITSPSEYWIARFPSLRRILTSSRGACEASVSKDGHNAWTRGHPSRRAQERAPQDEVGDIFHKLFRGR